MSAPEPQPPFPGGLPRPVEIFIATALLAMTLPVLALSWIAIRLGSRGPAIFRQTRIGLGGRPFQLLKLRTMRTGAGGGLLTRPADPRVTAVGRLLRASKLDELPQLWNVLVGDMSLVGPRPEVPAFVDPRSGMWRRVLTVRPGVTDPVSIRLRHEASWIEAAASQATSQATTSQAADESEAGSGGDPETVYRERLLPWKLAGYIDYLERRSPWRDVGVLWQTLLVVLFAAGRPVESSDPAAELAEPRSTTSPESPTRAATRNVDP